MKITVRWENQLAESSQRLTIEKNIREVLRHAARVKGITDQLLVLLTVDKPRVLVEGMALTPEGKRLFDVTYSLAEPHLANTRYVASQR